MKRSLIAAAIAACAMCGVLTGCVEEPPAAPVVTVVVDGQDVTVTGPSGSTLHASVADAATLPPPPAGTVFPLGALSLTVSGIEPGSVAVVTIALPQQVTGVRKLVDGLWDPFESDGTTGATLSPDGRTVTLTLLDGGRGDNDGMTNGVVVDPVAPTTDFFGCHESTTGNGDAAVMPGGTSVDQQYVLFALYSSSDGTCAGPVGSPVRAVLADPATAPMRCGLANGRISPAFEARLNGWDHAVLQDLWVCAWQPVPAATSMAGTIATTSTGSQTCGIINGQQYCGPGGSTTVAGLDFRLVGPCDGTSGCRLILPMPDVVGDLEFCGAPLGGGYRFSSQLLTIELHSAAPSSGLGTGRITQITGGTPNAPIGVIETISTSRTATDRALLDKCD